MDRSSLSISECARQRLAMGLPSCRKDSHTKTTRSVWNHAENPYGLPVAPFRGARSLDASFGCSNEAVECVWRSILPSNGLALAIRDYGSSKVLLSAAR